MHLLDTLHNTCWLAHTNPIPSIFIWICPYSHQSLVGEQNIHGNKPLDNLSTNNNLWGASWSKMDQLRDMSLNQKSHTHTCISSGCTKNHILQFKVPIHKIYVLHHTKNNSSCVQLSLEMTLALMHHNIGTKVKYARGPTMGFSRCPIYWAMVAMR